MRKYYENYDGFQYIIMLEKRYQKVFTQTSFNECQLLVEKKNSLFVSTKIWGYNIVENSSLKTPPSMYNTYLVNQKQVTTLPDFRILDSRPTKMQDVDSHNPNQSPMDIFACGNFEAGQILDKCHKIYLNNSIVNLVDKDSDKSVIMNLRTSLQVDSQKKRLYSQDFKYNEDKFDILGILPKRKTEQKLQKVHQVPLLDLHQTLFHNLLIQNLSFINEEEVLIHLGFCFQISSKNVVLCKYNIKNNTLQWKYHSNLSQSFFKRSVQISQNSFLNGTYLLQTHSSILQIFDYRMEGPALTVLTPNLPKAADFNHIERIENSFKFISLFSEKGGAINSPFIFDIRSPQIFQMIAFNQTKQNLFFTMKISYQKPFLYAIQRQYQNYKFKNAKLSKYHFQYPNAL